MSCERVRYALVLLTAGLLTGHAESSPRLGAILRDDGILVTVYGPATGPTLEPNPTATHYVFFAQADGVAAWAATTADSLIYSHKATHRAALAGKPRALSIAPNGMFVGVVVDNVVAIYFVDPLSHLFVREEYPYPLVILSYRFWQQRFNAEPAAIGKTLHLNGRDVTVLGVMPPTFDVPSGVDIWLPTASVPREP
jgi:hypothetical protein